MSRGGGGIDMVNESMSEKTEMRTGRRPGSGELGGGDRGWGMQSHEVEGDSGR